ncbi:hypothetical protein Pla100_61410 [Neorhodopirellula pilleata]|uniref:Uncharacterized protein n=1 Tax=Neorhodopirellula pilleata TaxID=2714738 RepID=A0A5C5ZH82_9BACT|nr:hypothetical protein Pla100_61410 [Neorhodopirellula pilleata]
MNPSLTLRVTIKSKRRLPRCDRYKPKAYCRVSAEAAATQPTLRLYGSCEAESRLGGGGFATNTRRLRAVDLVLIETRSVSEGYIQRTKW